MEPTIDQNLLADAEQHVRSFFEKHISPDYVFHNFPHSETVAESVREIGIGCQLSERELTILQLAAWFHDLGYDKGPANHEERSVHYATEFLSGHPFPEEDLQKVISCIYATKVPQHPDNLLEEIICDADMSHLGKESYWDRCGRIRQELLVTQQMIMSEQEWVDFELNFMLQHRYHTPVATELYNDRKQKHIRQLYKLKARLNPESAETLDIPSKPEKKKKKDKDKIEKKVRQNEQELKQLNLGRGVETMYRTTYRTHITLSSIADNKANIMMSITAIVISISVSTLVPKFETMPKLQVPTIFLLAVCLISMIFATLSTRPKVTTGTFTREDIKQRRTNLLFFGNYFNMDLEDFQWGMMEMIKDDDFLYSSMTRDLYYLGKVLAKKYHYLRLCYAVFMYGLIAAVVIFALFFVI
ncbi:MAG: HD family phosphohydrolase [Saprospirales bacterium]|nr:HD family phosphohydrolase [Saprospirales bacterium]